MLAGEFFPRQCHPLTDLPLVSSTLPGGKSARKAFYALAVQALLRKNAPRDVHCPRPAGPLLGKNCPQDSFPGPRNPLRITIRGKSPPDHPLLRCQRCLKCDDLFTRAFTLIRKYSPHTVPDDFTAKRKSSEEYPLLFRFPVSVSVPSERRRA